MLLDPVSPRVDGGAHLAGSVQPEPEDGGLGDNAGVAGRLGGGDVGQVRAGLRTRGTDGTGPTRSALRAAPVGLRVPGLG